MEIRQRDIKTYVGQFLDLLDREGITSLGDLVEKERSEYRLGSGVVELRMRPSNYGTQALVLSYFIEGVGILFETRLNSVLGESRVILKSVDRFAGYKSFATDVFGNVAQDRVIDNERFSFVRDELKRLANL